MTTPQKMMMQSIVKFGAVTVFAVVFYLDFVRPQGMEHIDTVKDVRETNRLNAETLKVLSESQVKSAEAQTTTAKALDGIKELMKSKTASDKLDADWRESHDQAAGG